MQILPDFLRFAVVFVTKEPEKCKSWIIHQLAWLATCHLISVNLHITHIVQMISLRSFDYIIESKWQLILTEHKIWPTSCKFQETRIWAAVYKRMTTLSLPGLVAAVSLSARMTQPLDSTHASRVGAETFHFSAADIAQCKSSQDRKHWFIHRACLPPPPPPSPRK